MLRKYQAVLVDHAAGCTYRNLAEPGPERQNGRVYAADFVEDRWHR